jgi:hypothetical protein
VTPFSPTSNVVVPGSRERSAASDEEVEAWLDDHGLSFGRHETAHCPWCGGATATCNDSVVIDERGVRCHRCQKFASWDHLVGRLIHVDKPSLYEAALAFVHFPHQEHILRDLRPNLPRELLKPAWRTMLLEVHRRTLEAMDADARDALMVVIERAASVQVDIVRSSQGAWLDRGTLKPRKLSADRTLKLLPWACSPIMVDAAQNGGPLAGFATVHPVDISAVIGPYVEPPRGAVFARPAPRGGDLPPVDLGDEPPTPAAVELAWAQVDLRLPQVDRAYVETLLCAQFCAQRATSTPPILIITGPPGGGKTAVQHLVAAMVGTRAGMFELGDSKATLRALGLLLSSRHNVTFVDEVGRIWDLYWKIEPLLRANSSIVFEAKYANEETIGVTAPISLLGSTLPASITRSSELGRRSVGIRVRGATKQLQSDRCGNSIWLATARLIDPYQRPFVLMGMQMFEKVNRSPRMMRCLPSASSCSLFMITALRGLARSSSSEAELDEYVAEEHRKLRYVSPLNRAR